ncbi:hypothetical protein RR46_04553 [Papilio xuthus]|uniref:Pacifastin domain-containing protein n=2 Tax=Papilio TaxID=7145 RepID=A0A194Q5B0_PAPXU|nr:hypothetical protein RR46_04553 [Papilio xuthus]
MYRQLVAQVCLLVYASAYGDDGRRAGPAAGTLSSVGSFERSPPLFRPGSQARSPKSLDVKNTRTEESVEFKGDVDVRYVVSQYIKPKPPHQYWEEETSLALVPETRNCLLCEAQDSGACRAMPSCVYCEPTVTALCERSTPCLRCTVIKNPFFKCIPGEKYMDECDSCRCTDGHGGWCTNQFCEFRALHLYAIKLSDGEFY